MDGVLIDSEPLYVEMNNKLFTELGIDIDVSEYHQFVGMSSPLMWTMLKERFSLPQALDELMNTEKERIHRLLCSDRISAPIAGVENLLKLLEEKGIAEGVASSSARKNVEAVLEKLDLTKYFSALVCGEDIMNGKPAPDIFLKAAKLLHTSPNDCAVIEDSRNGLLAAKAAGMTCIGYAGDLNSKQDLTGADLLIRSFHPEEIGTVLELLKEGS